MGWELLALGLPASGQPFSAVRFTQHLELSGRWLERGVIDGEDDLLLNGTPGLAGHRALGTLWFAVGGALSRSRREGLLDAARAVIDTDGTPRAGATSPSEGLVLVRALGERVEPVMGLLAAVRAAWRQAAWALPANPPRVWRL